MANKTLQEMADDIDHFRRNPADIQRVVLNTLEDSEDVVDPSSPFVFLLEAAVAVGAAGIQQNERLLRQRYPSLAQRPEELYHHMSDADYLGRFASPGKVTMTFLLSVDEIRERAIEDEHGIRRIQMPRNTQIEVEGYTFNLHYPIEIRVLNHGGIQVVYETSVDSPLQQLTSNQPEWSIVRMPGSSGDMAYVEVLRIDAELEQLQLHSKRENINRSSNFSRTYDLNGEQFYYARVFIEDDDQWREIHTTHSDLVYDPRDPTAQLYLLDDRLRVDIPYIYIERGLISNSLRIDIYTTQGNIEHCLGRYEPRNFRASWRDYSKEPSEYVSPIRSFNAITIFADDCIRGGKDAMSFEDLRERVIENASGDVDIPITPAHLESELGRMGYEIEKNVDHVTNRIYIATRTMTRPDVTVDINSVLGLTIRTLEERVEELTAIDTVYDNRQRATIASGTLFERKDGRLYIVDQSEIDELEDISDEKLIERVNDRDYLYTPFHYVLDLNDDLFDLRCYYLDEPRIKSKTFIDENSALGYQVSSRRYGISKERKGFRLVLETLSGDALKEIDQDRVHAFLFFEPDGESNYAYCEGVCLGRRSENDELLFEFDIETNFDIDDEHRLLTTNFQISEGADTDYAIGLDSKMDLLFAIEPDDPEDFDRSDLDEVLPTFLTNDSTYAVSRERLNVEFGQSLDGLWRRARTIVRSQSYETYDHDVPAYYEEPVFERDEDGLLVIEYDEDSGEVDYNLLHEAGDPVLDDDGEQVYRARAGDRKVDENGDPIELEPRKKTRQFDLLLIEGVFAFVTEESSKRYLEESLRNIVEWATEDIDSIQEQMLENTRLWLYPRSTIGDVSVLVEDGVSTTIDSEQNFVVTYYLDHRRYSDSDLREELERIAVEEIDEELSQRVVSTSAIVNRIHERIGDEIIDVGVSGFGEKNYQVLTVQEGSSRLGIKKRLWRRSDHTLAVEDDVEIRFLRHSE